MTSRDWLGPKVFPYSRHRICPGLTGRHSRAPEPFGNVTLRHTFLFCNFSKCKNCLHTQSHKEISVGLIKGAHKPQVLAMPNNQESGRVGVARVGRLSHRCHPDRKVLGGRVQNNGTITRDYKHVLSTKWMLAWEDTCADKTASFIIFTNQYDSPVPT